MIIAATGHRPSKLGGYSQAAFKRLTDVADTYLRETKPDHVISGMAIGWDQAFAHAAIALGTPLTAALPFSGQEKRWPAASQETWRSILRAAARVEVVSKGAYAAWKLQRRNEWMVDNADAVLALWDGSSGGTANCVAYAARVGKPVTNLYEQWKAVRP